MTFKEFGLPWRWDVDLYIELLAVAGGKERLAHYCRCIDPARLAQPDGMAFIARLHERKTRVYERRVEMGEVPARPGVSRLIGELRAAGIRLAIATTTSRSNVDILLATTLADLSPNTFEVIGAGEQATAKKPAPVIYTWALAQMQLPAANCLAIEDSKNGVHAARGTGMSVLVTVNVWTRDEDFTGAAVVLEDLGASDLAALRQWHEGNV